MHYVDVCSFIVCQSLHDSTNPPQKALYPAYTININVVAYTELLHCTAIMVLKYAKSRKKVFFLYTHIHGLHSLRLYTGICGYFL